jgi:NADPH-dependent 2,4-dienoyl-CoA reductase/sulfur reductase-like enzyme
MGGTAVLPLMRPCLATSAAPRVVVVGGGFGGATVARQLLGHDATLKVTLVERSPAHVTCPFSNLVLAGGATLEGLTHRLDGLRRRGVEIVRGEAARVEPQRRTLILTDGSRLGYDRLVLSPGIELDPDGLPGYGEAAMERMPHAWRAGPQTARLRAQLEAMRDGGTVIITVPSNPYRCPPGPYERACLIGDYLRRTKPRSKILILDAKATFSKQALFMQAFENLYPGMIEWRAVDAGGEVLAVDAATMTVETEFGMETGDVINVIPPQRAGALAARAGLVDATGWCPIDPVSFASTLAPAIHIIGDAAITAPMPKSATAANSHAKTAAAAIVAELRGQAPEPPALSNTCYSFSAPDQAFSVTATYVARGLEIEETGGGVSPLEASVQDRRLEAIYARDWYRGVTYEAWGGNGSPQELP